MVLPKLARTRHASRGCGSQGNPAFDISAPNIASHSHPWSVAAYRSSPVDPFEQYRELRRRERNRSTRRLWPSKSSALQSLSKQTQPVAIPPELLCHFARAFPFLLRHCPCLPASSHSAPLHLATTRCASRIAHVLFLNLFLRWKSVAMVCRFSRALHGYPHREFLKILAIRAIGAQTSYTLPKPKMFDLDIDSDPISLEHPSGLEFRAC
jgi:hypothetical protein